MLGTLSQGEHTIVHITFQGAGAGAGAGAGVGTGAGAGSANKLALKDTTATNKNNFFILKMF